MNLLVAETIYQWPLRPCGHHTLTYNSQHLSHVYSDHGLINYTYYLKSGIDLNNWQRKLIYCTNITMDCDVAMEAYHVNWDNPERCIKIVLHFGDFHLVQAFFGCWKLHDSIGLRGYRISIRSCQL